MTEKNVLKFSLQSYEMFTELSKRLNIMPGGEIIVKLSRKHFVNCFQVVSGMCHSIEKHFTNDKAIWDAQNDPEILVLSGLVCKFYWTHRALDSNCNRDRQNWIQIGFAKNEIDEFVNYLSNVLLRIEQSLVLIGADKKIINEIDEFKILSGLLAKLTRKNS